jgi:hypothetical protein
VSLTLARAVPSGGAPGALAGRVALLVESPAPSMSEPLRVVAEQLGDRALMLAANPRIGRLRSALPLAAWEWLGGSVPWAEVLRIRNRARRWWRSLVAERPRWPLADRDPTAAVVRAAAPIIARSLPWLAAEAAAIDRIFSTARPRALVVASDQHRLGRLAVGRALGAGVPTLVLQHGWPQYEIGYVPVAADAVAVWSEASADWFVERGTPRTVLQILGNPRLDRALRVDRTAAAASVARRLELVEHPRLLVTLSPGDKAGNDELVRIALTLANRGRASVVVKTHPGGGTWGALDRLLRDRFADVPIRVVRDMPLPPLLCWSDVVLLRRSTVALEALAFRVPVVTLAERPDDGDNAGLPVPLPAVATSDELSEALTTLAGPGAASYFAALERELPRVLGPLDGRVAERIARFAEDLSGGIGRISPGGPAAGRGPSGRQVPSGVAARCVPSAGEDQGPVDGKGDEERQRERREPQARADKGGRNG